MKNGLLLSAAGVMLIINTNVQAVCIPKNDCATLGYKYSAADCDSEGLACPFDTTRYNCANPCTYTVTAATCSSQCKNVGAKSCTRGSVTYYESCGGSKCSGSEECSNGTCKSTTTYIYCCDDVGYGCNQYYSRCMSFGYWGKCSDLIWDTSFQIFDGCNYGSMSSNNVGDAIFIQY